MKCYKARSPDQFPSLINPKRHHLMKPIPRQHSICLNSTTQKQLLIKRLHVCRIQIDTPDHICAKKRKYFKNLKTVTHLKPKLLWKRLTTTLFSFPNLLLNLKRMTTDIHQTTLDSKIFFKFMNKMKHLSKLDDLNQYQPTRVIRIPNDSGTYDAYFVNTKDIKAPQKRRFPMCKKIALRNLSVSIMTTVSAFFDIIESIQKFIARSHSSIALYASDYSNDQFLKLLSLLEHSYKGPETSIYLAKLSYSFHQPIDLQDSIISYLTKAVDCLREIVFEVEVNSTHWFNDWRIENWKKMTELIEKRQNSSQLFKMTFNIKFNNDINQDSLQNIIEQIAGLMHLCLPKQTQKSCNFGIEVNLEVECTKTAYGLSEFMEKVLKPMDNISLVKCDICFGLPKEYHNEVLLACRKLQGKKIAPVEISFEGKDTWYKKYEKLNPIMTREEFFQLLAKDHIIV